MTTRTFTVDELEDLGVDSGADDIVSNEVVDTRRWYEIHEVVFPYEGQLWAVRYRAPLTEMQEGIEPFASDPVVATLVEPYEVSVTKYRPVI
jgi:hypothetical protein